MNDWVVDLFKKLSTVMFLMMIAGPAWSGFAWGRLFDLAAGSRGTGALVGGAVGAGAGLLIATWTLGLVHTLLSIDDRLLVSNELQRKMLEALRSFPPASPQAAPSDFRQVAAEPARPAAESRPVVQVAPPAEWENMTERGLMEQLEARGFEVVDNGQTRMVQKDGLKRYPRSKSDLIMILFSDSNASPASVVKPDEHGYVSSMTEDQIIEQLQFYGYEVDRRRGHFELRKDLAMVRADSKADLERMLKSELASVRAASASP